MDNAPHSISPTLTYNFGRDDSLKEGQQVRILTLQGRIITPYQGYHKHMALLQQGATIGAAKLWHDRSRKHCYLLIALSSETPDPAPESHTRIVGVDVGQRSSFDRCHPGQRRTVLQRQGATSEGGP